MPLGGLSTQLGLWFAGGLLLGSAFLVRLFRWIYGTGKISIAYAPSGEISRCKSWVRDPDFGAMVTQEAMAIKSSISAWEPRARPLSGIAARLRSMKVLGPTGDPTGDPKSGH